MSILPKGRSFTANSGTKVAVLLKGMSSTSIYMLYTNNSTAMRQAVSFAPVPQRAQVPGRLSRSGPGFDPRLGQTSWVCFFFLWVFFNHFIQPFSPIYSHTVTQYYSSNRTQFPLKFFSLTSPLKIYKISQFPVLINNFLIWNLSR